MDDDAAQALWRTYCEATVADPSPLGEIEGFGDSPEIADELLGLVPLGTKTATAGLAQDDAGAGEVLPGTGRVPSRRRRPGRGAVRATDRGDPGRHPGTVDDDLAWDEGEGDRTRAAAA